MIEKVRTLVADKAGTLTGGGPAVTTMEVADSTTKNELVSLAAAVERNKEHPLAQALVKGRHRGIEKFPQWPISNQLLAEE